MLKEYRGRLSNVLKKTFSDIGHFRRYGDRNNFILSKMKKSVGI
jgi:hypothetical protein